MISRQITLRTLVITTRCQNSNGRRRCHRRSVRYRIDQMVPGTTRILSNEGRAADGPSHEWIPLISNHGFPIFVSWYLLTKVDSRIEALSTTIVEMTTVIRGWKKETRGHHA
jgi:hypothetical protein